MRLTLADGAVVYVAPDGNVSLVSGECQCTRDHKPAIISFDVHHVVPQSWGGQSVADNLVVACPNTHRMTHLLLNEYVRHQGVVTADIAMPYSRLTRALAKRAWKAHDPAKPTPMTLDHGSPGSTHPGDNHQ